MTAIIVDTGPLVALLDRTESRHEWAKSFVGGLRRPMLTCDAVISETMFLLKRGGNDPTMALGLIERGVIASTYGVQGEAPQLVALMERYQNVPMSLADACLVRMAEIHEGAQILTMDSDFAVYRKFERQPIPVIMPG